MRLKTWTAIVGTIILVAASPLSALAKTNHKTHHPQTTATTETNPAMGGQPNMMGGAQMQQGMMGSMPMGNSMGMMGGMGMTDHIEGRIAFLRTELKITNSQTRVWNNFADALRSNATNMDGMRMSIMQMMSEGQSQPPSLSQHLDLMEQMLTARLDGLRSFRAPLTALYGVLSDEQKKTADELFVPHMV